MKDVLKQLNWALLLSHKIYGGPPPDSCRKAWCSLLTISLKLHDRISDVLDAKLDALLHSMYDPNENNNAAIVNSLQNLINVATSQSGNQIPKTDADAVIVAAQELIRPLRKPTTMLTTQFQIQNE